MCGKKHPGVNIPTCLVFFQTCWVKVKHLPLPQVSILSCFGLHLFCSWVVFLSHSGCKTVKPSIKVSWSSHSLYLMIPCLKKIFLCKRWLVWFKMITPKVFSTLVSPCQCCSTDLTVERKIFLIDEPPPLQFEGRRRRSTYGSVITPFSHDLKNWRTFHDHEFVEKSIVLCCCGTCSLTTITLNEFNIALSCKKHTCLVKKKHICVEFTIQQNDLEVVG